MNVFNRAFVSITRRKGKSFILLGSLVLTLILTSGAISIRQAIMNTDQNLRSQLPALATLSIDQEAIDYEEEATGQMVNIDHLSASIIREIGALPYVQMFDYTAWGHNFFSDELVRAFNPELFVEVNLTDEILIDYGSLFSQGDIGLEWFILKGIYEPSVVDIEAELIELTNGRTFTEAEVNNAAKVAIVSQDFLEVNQLTLGGTFTLDYHIYQEVSGQAINIEEHYSADHLIIAEPFELEIIGVFKHDLSENVTLDEVRFHLDIINRVYVPNRLIESTVDLHLEAFLDSQPELLEEILAVDDLEEIIQYEQIIFLLHDPVNLADFQKAATAIIPEFWIVSDLSNAYADIASSMETMKWLADGLLIGSVGATLVILSLLIVLFLRDRKEEIGIYLALGARKISVIWQVVIEVMAVSLVAMTVALFVGYLLGDSISTIMIRSDLARHASEEDGIIQIFANTPESMGFRHEISHEEMLASYDVSLDSATIIIFYIIAIGTILFSTVMPIIYLIRLNPKKILLLG